MAQSSPFPLVGTAVAYGSMGTEKGGFRQDHNRIGTGADMHHDTVSRKTDGRL